MFKRTVILMLFVIAFLGTAFAQQAESKRNESLRSAVSDPVFKSYSNVQIDVLDSVVTVKGSVSTYWDKCKVHQIIQSVQGVKSIRNFLTIKTPFRLGESIRGSILNDLNRNKKFARSDSIRIGVSQGLVILSGKVASQKEKQLAFSIAAWQKGVHSVVNNLKVDYQLTATSADKH